MVNIKENYISNTIAEIPPIPSSIDDKDVSILKITVTPDEIIMGMNYEVGRMPTKNKEQAKTMVVQNLKKDPKFYSSLHAMGMTDYMIKENMNKEEEKKQAFKEIFDELIDRDKQIKKRNIDQRVVDAYVETVDKNKKRRQR